MEKRNNTKGDTTRLTGHLQDDSSHVRWQFWGQRCFPQGKAYMSSECAGIHGSPQYYLSSYIEKRQTKTCDAGDTPLTAIKKPFQEMTWNTELLLTEGGPWAQAFDEARNNLSAARDQFFLHPQQSSFLIKAQFQGKDKASGP